MRQKYNDLDKRMSEYELYIEQNGLPFCDYKLYRTKNNDIKPIEKFKNGVKRIMRILNSYKTSAFTDLLKKIQEQMQEEKREKEKNQKKKVLFAKPQNHEQRVEQMLSILTNQVSELTEKVNYLQDRAVNCT